MSGLIFPLLFLMLSGCNSTGSVTVVPKAEPPPRVPAALIKPCPPKSRKPLVTTGDVVDRLLYTEGALDVCAAQVRGIAKWDADTAANHAATAQP